jgi:hypothetical protein
MPSNLKGAIRGDYVIAIHDDYLNFGVLHSLTKEDYVVKTHKIKRVKNKKIPTIATITIPRKGNNRTHSKRLVKISVWEVVSPYITDELKKVRNDVLIDIIKERT